jgi:type II secretory pathway pseudopilin PulG
MSRTTRRKGLSLVEVLITTAICSTLMIAVAAAFQASAQAVEQNQRFFRASQTARVCLTQVMAEARRCRSGVVDDTSLELVTAAGETRTYAYDVDAQQITMAIHTPLPPYPTYVVARNVTAARFDASGNALAMSLTVAVNNQTLSLSGSALPRKMMTYR